MLKKPTKKASEIILSYLYTHLFKSQCMCYTVLVAFDVLNSLNCHLDPQTERLKQPPTTSALLNKFSECALPDSPFYPPYRKSVVYD